MGLIPAFEIENEIMRSGCDILIASPGRLGQYIQNDNIALDELQYLVVDEMDKFFSVN